MSAEIVGNRHSAIDSHLKLERLYVNRTANCEMQQEVIQTELSIMIQAYNRIDKIRRAYGNVFGLIQNLLITTLILIDTRPK